MSIKRFKSARKNSNLFEFYKENIVKFINLIKRKVIRDREIEVEKPDN